MVEAPARYQAKLRLVAAMRAGKSWQSATQEALLLVSRATAYRLARWAKQVGESRLREGRHGHPSKLHAPVREWLEQYYQQHPLVTGAEVQAMVQEHFGAWLSVTHLNRFRATLRAAGRLGEMERTEWRESAGSLLLLAAAQQTGLIAALDEAMPTTEAPRRFSQARPQAKQQCALTLLFLSSVGLKRPWDLRSYTGDGLALLSCRSRTYGYHHIERFLAHWTLAGGAERMTEALVKWTAHLWHEPMTTAYLDGHRKPVYTDALIPRGLIGHTGKILGCRALVLLHDAHGHPRWVSTHRGDTHLTQETEFLLARNEAFLSPQTVNTIIVDREGMATEFLRRLTRAGREVITLLRADQYTGVASFTQVREFTPLCHDRQGRVIHEVAPAQFALQDLTVEASPMTWGLAPSR